ncbi:MAG: glycosyltransferase 87 family protein [Planctomycetota bacterium]
MKRTWPWLLILLLAAMVGGALYFDRQAKKGDREIDVYIAGGQRMADGAEIYRRGSDAKPFTYPPFAAVPFVPFVLLPESWHAEAWFVVNFVVLLLLIRWLHRWARSQRGQVGEGAAAPPKRWALWFWLPTALFGGRHIVSVFTNQSHDLLICGMLAMLAAAWCRGGRLAALQAGFWAGLGAATKATPLIFLGLFGLRLRVVGVVSVVVATVGATLLPDLMFPRGDGQAWWRAWYDINLSGMEVGGTADAPGAWGTHSFLNQGLSGTLTRWFRPVGVDDVTFVVGEVGDVLCVELSAQATKYVTLAGSMAVLAVISLGVLGSWRALRSVPPGIAGSEVRAQIQSRVGMGEVGAFACGMLLLSPQSSKAHFCVWIFPVAFVVDFVLRRRRDAVAIVLFAVAFGFAMLSKGMLGRSLANVMLAWGSVTWATVFLLLATVRCLWLSARVGSEGADTAGLSA